MTTSVFDRLAHQGTAASDARCAREKECREQQQQRRAAAAAALIPVENPVKLQLLHPPQDPSPTPTRSPKTPREQDEFFDRLSHQDTISSAAHHIPANHGCANGHVNVHKTATSPSEQTEVFNRLYKQETVSSKAHHLKEEEQPPHTPKKFHPSSPPSFLKRLEDEAANENGPKIPLRVNLHIRSKEEKKGGKPYTNLNLTHADVRKQINIFHCGKTSAHALAFDVISELFHRDFEPGDHWEIEPAVLNQLDPLTGKKGEKIEIFDASKVAVWDWKDIYSVATAKATIKLSRKDIYVDEYSYYVAG